MQINSELVLIVQSGLVIKDSEEYKILHHILSGGREMTVFGIQYGVTNVETFCSTDESPVHTISARRLIEVKLPRKKENKHD